MYVPCSRLLFLPTVTALVVVPLTGSALLFVPIWTIILLVGTASPVRVVLASLVHRQPLRITLPAAKTMMCNTFRYFSHHFALLAFNTKKRNRRTMRGIPQPGALITTKSSMSKTRFDLFFSPTLTTGYVDIRTAGSHSSRHSNASTPLTAVHLLSLFQAESVRGELNIAHGTIDHNMPIGRTANLATKPLPFAWALLKHPAAVRTFVCLSWHSETPIGMLATCLGTAKSDRGYRSLYHTPACFWAVPKHPNYSTSGLLWQPFNASGGDKWLP